MDKPYIDAVRLLLETVPVVFEQPRFAMKGGTAINLFVEDMPRLSVDIDIVYTDHKANREEALAAISTSLEKARKKLAAWGIQVEVARAPTGEEIKMFVRRKGSQVKIEVNYVFRGTILPVETRRLTAKARDLFTTTITVPTLALAELYGSKLVAAMDRQHPRDLYDVRGMYAKTGLTPAIVECFVCYLAGHRRPVHEVLFSRNTDMAQAYQNELMGMVRDPASLADLVSTRERLKKELPAALTTEHRRFLLGLVMAEPDWSLIACPHLADLPAIRWKLQNLNKLKKSNRAKFTQQADELRTRLSL